MSGDISRAYDILGLSPGASQEEIKRAYRDLVKVWHPDRFQNDPLLQRKAEEELKKINEAYEILQKFGANRAANQSYTSKPQPNWAQGESKSHDRTSQAPKQSSPSPPSGSSQRTGRVPRLIPIGSVIFILWILVRLFSGSGSSPPSSPTPAPPAWPSPPDQVVVDPGTPTPPSPNTPAPSAPTSPSSQVPPNNKKSTSPQPAKPAPSIIPSIPSRPPAPSGPPIPGQPDSFTIGSTKEEVLAAQGQPNRMGPYIWWYGTSSVDFDFQGRVNGYSNSGNLRVHVSPSTNTSVSSFTIGSTKDEVLAAQGQPTRMGPYIWWYGSSSVDFDFQGRVNGYSNNGNLKIRAK